MTATFTLTGMRIPKEHLASIFEGVRIMHKTTAWDAAIDVGIVLCQLAVLRHLGKKRLGEPGPKTQAELSAIQDVDRILRMIDEVPTAKFGRRFSW
jgi:hypothetical protein